MPSNDLEISNTLVSEKPAQPSRISVEMNEVLSQNLKFKHFCLKKKTETELSYFDYGICWSILTTKLVLQYSYPP